MCVGTWTNIVRGRLSTDETPATAIPELTVTPDRYVTVRYAGASGDFNPIHVDDEFARQVGLPGQDPPRPVDDGPGRARPDRGRRRAAARCAG